LLANAAGVIGKNPYPRSAEILDNTAHLRPPIEDSELAADDPTVRLSPRLEMQSWNVRGVPSRWVIGGGGGQVSPQC
jgi:hypothetical protein